MATYSLPHPNSNCCNENGVLQCPETTCGQCTDCYPLYCVTIPPYPTLYNTVLVTDTNGNPVFDAGLQECLHIPYQMGASPPTDTWVDTPGLQTYPESFFQPGSDFDCDPNYCENNPYDSFCDCYPEEDFKWNGQESVEVSFYWWDFMQDGHYLDQTFTMDWVSWFCGYQGSGYSLYRFQGLHWVFLFGQGEWYQYGDSNSNIFTYVGRDPTFYDYIEIL